MDGGWAGGKKGGWADARVGRKKGGCLVGEWDKLFFLFFLRKGSFEDQKGGWLQKSECNDKPGKLRRSKKGGVDKKMTQKINYQRLDEKLKSERNRS